MSNSHATLIYLCNNCVGDDFLSQEISRKGSNQKCDFCGKSNIAVDIEIVCDQVDNAFHKYYIKGGPEIDISSWNGSSDNIVYIQSGDNPIEIIETMVEVERDIAESIFNILASKESSHAKKANEEVYNSGKHYELREPFTEEFTELWDKFSHNVKHKERFFSKEGVDILDEIFDGIEKHVSMQDNSLFRDVGPGTEVESIYRAREIPSDISIINILQAPAEVIGPPPKTKAQPGRMNPSGIPAFYGCLEPDTCIPEIRLPVGGMAIVGTFHFLKKKRVLDLTLLEEGIKHTSMFDPKFEHLRDHAAFLHRFHHLISFPVLPSDEAINYVPTQAVAEYLSNHLKPEIDGVIFRSTQTEGKNIVLFNKSSRINLDSGVNEKLRGGGLFTTFKQIMFGFLITEQSEEGIMLLKEGGHNPKPYELSEYSSTTDEDDQRKIALDLVKIELIEATKITYENNPCPVNIDKLDEHSTEDFLNS